MAYKNNTHHSHYSNFSYDEDIISTEDFERVESNLGELLPTTSGFKVFKKFIEKSIYKSRNIEFYNYSEGAIIKGAKYINEDKLKSILGGKTC